LWDLSSQKMTAEWHAQSKKITSLAFNPEGTRLAVSNASGSIFIFDPAVTFSPLFEIKDAYPVAALAFSPDSRCLYAAGDSPDITVWNLETQRKTARWESGSPKIISLALRGDTLVSGGSGGILTLWDAPRQLSVAVVNTETFGSISVIQFSPDGKQLALISDSYLQIWDIASLSLMRDWYTKDLFSLVYSPDECTLAIGSHDSLKLLDTGLDATYKMLMENIGATHSLAFSPDGSLLASGHTSGELQIWGVDGALEALGGASIPPVRCGTFSPLPTATSTFRPTATLVVAPTATPPLPAFSRTLSLTDPNMRGDDVFLLQQRLVELGYTEVGETDGVFGKMTDAAVRRFQEANGLEVDGYVGPQTWLILFGPNAVPAG